MNVLPIILGMAAVTYAPRLAGLWLRVEVPPFWQRFLRFVPIAAFSALVVPALPGERGEAGVRLFAALLAAVATWRFRKLWLGILVGMAAYWLLR
ncbi:AzlD domain-containing protein [Corallococcus sp. H22C18031201]|uniref:AzlD domain-containing protein n=1 Tax=Citreicoccus inhibens TaxID=2849499 RepID=UPI000E74B60E|nr:AzlD domain-containing protein [Citreicoccus inhibens]MBU8899842.1 AzlD domain-containing protein [Citreicoccus inhibens]RJS21822.1 AzlD domain-containing protein [Corallococcus sp. H22C18031201]